MLLVGAELDALNAKSASTKTITQLREAEDIQALLTLIKGQWGIPPRLIFHSSRCRADIALTRQIAMYLVHVMLGRSLTEVGLIFGRDRTTVGHACAHIEDMRDDARFEAEISLLETALEAYTPCCESLEAMHAA
jgi:chromosomal replication initiation ATPase DnaA